MSNILVITVGESYKQVVNAIETNKPSYIFFICSDSPSKGSTVDIVNSKILSEIEISPKQCKCIIIKNPDELSEVIKCCKDINQQIDKKYGKNCSVIANYSSGTKSMAMGLGICSTIYPNWELQIQSRYREDFKKVNLEGISEKSDLNEFYFQKLLQDLKHLKEKQEYDSCLELISQFKLNNRINADSKVDLDKKYFEYECLSNWKRFEYDKAIESGKKMKCIDNEKIEELRVLRNLSEALDQGNQKRLKSKTFNGFEIVEDVVENAIQCAKESRFDGAIARLYRATEMLAQIQLLKHYGINSSDIDVSHSEINQSIQDWLTSIKRDNKYQTALMHSFELLKMLNDPLGEYWLSHKKSLQGFISERNDSFLAHGYKPIDKDVWRKKGKSWLKWIKNGIEVAIQK